MNPERYQNLSGDSGITRFAVGEDFVAVQFQGSTVYIYDHYRPGREHVAQMKVRALAGRGLATYINQHVRKEYARKQPSW